MKKRWRRLARSALALVSGAALSMGSGALAQISPARPDVTRPPSDSATRKAQLCPRERTVLAAAQLVDEAGVSIGALADGAVVTLLDAPRPADGNRVWVAAEKPFWLRALARAEDLQIFAKVRIDLVPGFSWLERGAPLVVLGTKQDSLLVAPFEPHRKLEDYRRLAKQIPCAAAAGTSVYELDHDRCHGAAVVWPPYAPEGAVSVSFETETIKKPDSVTVRLAAVLSDGRGHQHRAETFVGRLLREKGELGLVELLEDDGVGYRGWVDRRHYKRIPEGHGSGSSHLCCEAYVEDRWPRDSEGATQTLRETAGISALETGTPFMTLAAGTSVLVHKPNGKRQQATVWFDDGERRLGGVWGWIHAKAVGGESGSPDAGR